MTSEAKLARVSGVAGEGRRHDRGEQVTARAVAAELASLKRLARSKTDRRPGLLIMPRHALRTARRSSAVDYALDYFRTKVRAPFTSPLASEFEFRTEEVREIETDTRSGPELVAAVENDMQNVALYLSNYLTHPHYEAEAQVGFVRGDTLRPEGLRRAGPGRYRYRVHGLAVGRRDLLRILKGPNVQGPPAPKLKAPPPGWDRIFICMPTEPDAPEVDRTEWYEFSPKRWARDHPKIPLCPPISVLLRRQPPLPALAPQYDRLYRDGVIRIAFIFGYDEGTHLAADDARQIWKVLTSRTTKKFTVAETGEYGYHGPGLGFSDPCAGKFTAINLDGTSVFRRDSVSGAGPVGVRYTLRERPLRVGSADAPEGTVFVGGKPVKRGVTLPVGTTITRSIAAEVRLYNFDKAAPRTSTQGLIDQFVSVFQRNDVIHYDGHANYGGGFYIGEQPDDILWADDIGDYAETFSSEYQIFSIGACHAAGYFADLFYNELAPRKSPRNLDMIAAVNEAAFEDAVHIGIELIRVLLQQRISISADPPDYDRILRQMSKPAAFHAYTGVFGHIPKDGPQGRKAHGK